MNPASPRSMLLSLLPLVMLLGISGCTLGVRKETHIVYSSVAKTPENVEGLVRIATNKPITVTVGEDNVSKLDLGGYFVVSSSDLSTMLEALERGVDE